MANYSVTTTTYTGTMAAILAAMETYIETIDNGKTIYVYGVHQYAYNEFIGVIVVDT